MMNMSSSPFVKSRDVSLDVIRSLACLLVIIIHSPMTGIGTSPFLLASTTLLGSPCIGLFFMVSGYLLLPTKDGMFPFLQRRLSKVLFPTLFWTAFYLLQLFFQDETFEGQTWTKTILSIPFRRQGCGFLWFMYALMGLYVLAPIISNWVATAAKKEIQLVLGLWLVTTCYSLLRPFVTLTEDTFGMLYYFTGYAGYFLLGAYIKRFTPKISYAMIGALYLLPFAVALYARLKGVDFLSESFGYLCLMTVMQTCALFMLFIKLPIPQFFSASSVWVKSIICFSNCSFGIYLMHKFVMRDVIWSFDFVSSYGGVFQIAITILLTTLLA